MKCLVIPTRGAIHIVDTDGRLDSLQQLVSGDIEAVVIRGCRVAAYVNTDGKTRLDLERNDRATALASDTLFPGDYIRGPLVMLGFDPRTGGYSDDLPLAILDKVRAIEIEFAAKGGSPR